MRGLLALSVLAGCSGSDGGPSPSNVCDSPGEYKVDGKAAVQCIEQPDGSVVWSEDKIVCSAPGFTIKTQPGKSATGSAFLWCEDGTGSISFETVSADDIPSRADSYPCPMSESGQYTKIVNWVDGTSSAGLCESGEIKGIRTLLFRCPEGFAASVSDDKSISWCKDEVGRLLVTGGSTSDSCLPADIGMFSATGVTEEGETCLLRCSDEGKLSISLDCTDGFTPTLRPDKREAHCLDTSGVMSLESRVGGCSTENYARRDVCVAEDKNKFRLAAGYNGDLVAAKCVLSDGQLRWTYDRPHGVACSEEQTLIISEDGTAAACVQNPPD